MSLDGLVLRRYAMNIQSGISGVGTWLALSVLLFPAAMKAQSSEPAPEELIRRVVENELHAERADTSHWMFRLETENKKGQQEVDEVVETNAGDLKRAISINGHSLTAEEQRQYDARFRRNLKALRKKQKDKNEDAAKSREMLRILPEAFLFSDGERRGDLEKLDFKPNPRFHPRNREAEVFHVMEGSVWLDMKQNRLVAISGHLTKRVEFVGGLLGHLDKDGTFDVKQPEVAPGYWELTRLDVNMNGKALFFKTIRVRQKYSRSEFKRVPNDLTVAQATEMLKKQSVSPGASGQ